MNIRETSCVGSDMSKRGMMNCRRMLRLELPGLLIEEKVYGSQRGGEATWCYSLLYELQTVVSTNLWVIQSKKMF